MKQALIIYSGDVIAVGFRLTANELASNLKLTGWVRNLADGRVELVVQGEESEIQKILDQLASIFQDRIEESKISWQKPMEKFTKFEIKY